MLFGSSNGQPDPDDYFADTRMSFGDHLEELRTHLWRAIWGFGVALIFGFVLGSSVLRFIAAPVEAELGKYWDRYYQRKNKEVLEKVGKGEIAKGRPMQLEIRIPKRQLLKELGVEPKDEKPPAFNILPGMMPLFRKLEVDDWIDRENLPKDYYVEFTAEVENPLEVASRVVQESPVVGRRPTLSTLNVQEAFMVYFKVSMVTGLVLASPWIFFQIWSFIAAGLYPHEKRYVNVFLPVSIGLFLAGVFVCEFFVIPKAVEALLWFNEWLELEPDFRLNEWLGFAVFMPLVFGISFQTPLVMLFVERIGVLTVDQFRKARRIAWFVMAVFAAVITPSTDALSMLFLWVPMSLLYEMGILMCILSPKRPTFDLDVPESEELIEV
jgi:sec-independent protein translocase protein TatC